MSLKYLEMENAIAISKMKNASFDLSCAKRYFDVYKHLITENTRLIKNDYKRIGKCVRVCISMY